jgi:hypothetical protein
MGERNIPSPTQKKKMVQVQEECAGRRCHVEEG